jgi:signal transduction histidine kinase
MRSEPAREAPSSPTARRGPGQRGWLTRASSPAFVLVASLLLTAVATAASWNSLRVRDRGRFENAAQSATDRIQARLEIYVALLRATAGLFAAEDVSRVDFDEFVAGLDLAERYGGSQGIGFSRRLHADSVAELERRMRMEGVADFRVWPAVPDEERHAIVYLGPLDERNAAAIGYDMSSEPTRRAAMERARDSGRPALSGRVELVQEIHQAKQAGFLIYVPVYRDGAHPATIAERRRLLLGFAYSPFRADDLFSGIFGTEEAPRVDFRVYDGAAADSAALLHDSAAGRGTGSASGFRPALSDTVRLDIAGHQWTLTFRPSPGFGPVSRTGMIPLLALTGTLVSLLMFGMTRALQSLSARADAARAAAEEANLAKTQFLARMSHELRTPLNAIAGYIDLIDLGVRGPVTPEQHKDLQRVKHAQNHLLGLINDVLNFAKLEVGRVHLHPTAVPVADAVADVEAMLGPIATAREIRYRRDAGDPAATVWADREKLQQILLNLVSNALKFTEAGGEVAVSWSARDGMVAIDVRDTGRGIPAAKLPIIFEPFVQVDAELTQTAEGAGLGLAISHELARAMGGDLTASSKEGEGSTFTLSLPAEAETAATEPDA